MLKLSIWQLLKAKFNIYYLITCWAAFPFVTISHILVLCFFFPHKINLREKDAQIEEMKRHVSEKQDRISKLEQDIANSRLELSERENKINDILQAEVSRYTLF